MQSSICTQNIPEFLQENWLQIEPLPKKNQMTQQQDMKVPCSKLIPRLLELYSSFSHTSLLETSFLANEL